MEDEQEDRLDRKGEGLETGERNGEIRLFIEKLERCVDV